MKGRTSDEGGTTYFMKLSEIKALFLCGFLSRGSSFVVDRGGVNIGQRILRWRGG